MQRNIINESLKLSKHPKFSLVTFQTKQTTAGRNVLIVKSKFTAFTKYDYESNTKKYNFRELTMI